MVIATKIVPNPLQIEFEGAAPEASSVPLPTLVPPVVLEIVSFITKERNLNKKKKIIRYQKLNLKCLHQILSIKH